MMMHDSATGIDGVSTDFPCRPISRSQVWNFARQPVSEDMSASDGGKGNDRDMKTETVGKAVLETWLIDETSAA